MVNCTLENLCNNLMDVILNENLNISYGLRKRNLTKSDKSDIDKVYVKWGILRWLWDKIDEISDKADELWIGLTDEFRKVASVVAWDMLDNSNRLTQAEALKQWLADYGIGIGKWGKKNTIKKIASSTIKTANNLLKAITPELKFISLPAIHEWWTIKWWTTTPPKSYNIEGIELRSASSQWTQSKWLTTPAPKLHAGKVIVSRVKWLKKYWGANQYQKIIKW